MLGGSQPPITLAPKGVGGFFWALGFLADTHNFVKKKKKLFKRREIISLPMDESILRGDLIHWSAGSLSSPVQTTQNEQGKWGAQLTVSD